MHSKIQKLPEKILKYKFNMLHILKKTNLNGKWKDGSTVQSHFTEKIYLRLKPFLYS